MKSINKPSETDNNRKTPLEFLAEMKTEPKQDRLSHNLPNLRAKNVNTGQKIKTIY